MGPNIVDHVLNGSQCCKTIICVHIHHNLCFDGGHAEAIHHLLDEVSPTSNLIWWKEQKSKKCFSSSFGSWSQYGPMMPNVDFSVDEVRTFRIKSRKPASFLECQWKPFPNVARCFLLDAGWPHEAIKSGKGGLIVAWVTQRTHWTKRPREWPKMYKLWPKEHSQASPYLLEEALRFHAQHQSCRLWCFWTCSWCGWTWC